jgi:RHS repeat-associated protein
LGNILATITDNKIYQTNGSLAKVISGTDYYAFGAAMPSRSFQDAGYSKYRYGFNGKENDDDFQDYGMRVYCPECGVFLSIDPIASKYPELSPYQFASRSPIVNIDLDGLEDLIANDGRVIGVGPYSGKTKQKLLNEYHFDILITTFIHPDIRVGFINEKYPQKSISGILSQVENRVDGLSHIPHRIQTEKGNVINTSFQNTSSDGLSSDNRVDRNLVIALILTLNNVNNNLPIESITISATTNGQHSNNSAHYSENGSRAVDISRVNNERLINIGDSEIVKSIQKEYEKLGIGAENFGPSLNTSFGRQTLNPKIINTHKDHFHFALRLLPKSNILPKSDNNKKNISGGAGYSFSKGSYQNKNFVLPNENK